eukprot:255613_1
MASLNSSSDRVSTMADLYGLSQSFVEEKLTQLKFLIGDVSEETLLDYLSKHDLDVQKAINSHFNSETFIAADTHTQSEQESPQNTNDTNQLLINHPDTAMQSEHKSISPQTTNNTYTNHRKRTFAQMNNCDHDSIVSNNKRRKLTISNTLKSLTKISKLITTVSKSTCPPPSLSSPSPKPSVVRHHAKLIRETLDQIKDNIENDDDDLSILATAGCLTVTLGQLYDGLHSQMEIESRNYSEKEFDVFRTFRNRTKRLHLTADDGRELSFRLMKVNDKGMRRKPKSVINRYHKWIDDEKESGGVEQKKNTGSGGHEAAGDDHQERICKTNPKKEKEDQNIILRSPICVVIEDIDVDAGNTILNHLRNTIRIQNKDGGFGATHLGIDNMKASMKELVSKYEYKVPGLLLVDSPGIKSVASLCAPQSSMCDIVLLVINGNQKELNQQQKNVIKTLQEQQITLIVCMILSDDWKPNGDAFDIHLQQAKIQFAEQGVNVKLYTKNKRMDRDVCLVPISATGEGIIDVMRIILELTERDISFNANTTKISLLEVKQTERYGSVLQVMMCDGTLKEEDDIVICGMNGPIVSAVRTLLLPNEEHEMHVKGECRRVREVSASKGVRIACVEDVKAAVPGAPLFIVPRNLVSNVERQSVIEYLKDEVQTYLTAIDIDDYRKQQDDELDSEATE